MCNKTLWPCPRLYKSGRSKPSYISHHTSLIHKLVPITLWIEKRICVSGGIVEGIIELNFVRLQEEHVDEVRVELKGSANTYVISASCRICSFVIRTLA